MALFGFQPSAEWIRRVESLVRQFVPEIVEIPDDQLAGHQKELGRVFAGHIGSIAQYTRYIPKSECTLIENGVFTKEIFDSVGDRFVIPEGEEGDALITDLSKEFLAWVKEGNNATDFSPRAPIERFVIEGENVKAIVRPKEPPFEDPDFVQATIVE